MYHPHQHTIWWVIAQSGHGEWLQQIEKAGARRPLIGESEYMHDNEYYYDK